MERTGTDGTLIWADDVLSFSYRRSFILTSVQWNRWCVCFFSRCFLSRPLQVSPSNTYSISIGDITSLAQWIGRRGARPVKDQHASWGVVTWCEKGWSCVVRKSCPVILFPSRLLFRRYGESRFSTHRRFPALLTFYKLLLCEEFSFSCVLLCLEDADTSRRAMGSNKKMIQHFDALHMGWKHLTRCTC